MEHNSDLKRLEEAEAENDLGVYIYNTMKPALHCRKPASKAMSALRPLRITFGALTKSNLKLLYTMYREVQGEG